MTSTLFNNPEEGVELINDLHVDNEFELGLAVEENEELDDQDMELNENRDAYRFKLPGTKHSKKPPEQKVEKLPPKTQDEASLLQKLKANEQISPDDLDAVPNVQFLLDDQNNSALMIATLRGDFKNLKVLIDDCKQQYVEGDDDIKRYGLLLRNDEMYNLFQLAVIGGNLDIIKLWFGIYKKQGVAFLNAEVWNFPQKHSKEKKNSTLHLAGVVKNKIQDFEKIKEAEAIIYYLAEEHFSQEYKGTQYLGPSYIDLIGKFVNAKNFPVPIDVLNKAIFRYTKVMSYKSDYKDKLDENKSDDKALVASLLKKPLRDLRSSNFADTEFQLQLLGLITAILEKNKQIELFPTQILGDIILLMESIDASVLADIKMNEGKSFMFVMLAAYFGLLGYEVYFTSNTPGLVSRDKKVMDAMFDILGIQQKVIASTPAELEIALLRNKVYGTKIFGFTPKVGAKKILLQDEVDVPARISYLQGARLTLFVVYPEVEKLASTVAYWMHIAPDTILEHFNQTVLHLDLAKVTESREASRWHNAAIKIYKKIGAVAITELGVEYMAQLNRDICNLIWLYINENSQGKSEEALDKYLKLNLGKWAPVFEDVKNWFHAALYIKKNMALGNDYEIKETINPDASTKREVIIFEYKETGNPMPGQRWQFYIHSLIEAKEGCDVNAKSLPIATMNNCDLFKEFKIIGMSGTVGGKHHIEQMKSIYPGLKCYTFPPRKEVKHAIQDVVGVKGKSKQKRNLRNILEKEINAGNSAIVFCKTVDSAKNMHDFIKQIHVAPNQIGLYTDDFNSKENEELLSRAGADGFVLVGTAIISRGVDIKKHPSPIAGGNKTKFVVIITYLPVSREAALQLHYRIREIEGKIYYLLDTNEVNNPFIRTLLQNQDKIDPEQLTNHIYDELDKTTAKIELNSNNYKIAATKSQFVNLFLSLPKTVRIRFDRKWSEVFGALEDFIRTIKNHELQEKDLAAIENEAVNLMSRFWIENNIGAYLTKHEGSPLLYALNAYKTKRITAKDDYKKTVNLLERHLTNRAEEEIKLSPASSKLTIGSDELGLTRLHKAVLEGDEVQFKFLMLHASPDAIYRITTHKRTILHCAVFEGYIDLIYDILDAVKSEHGKSPAFVNLQDKQGKTALHLAIDRSDYKIAELLLQQRSTAVNAKDGAGFPPLFYAAAKKDDRMVLLLLKYQQMDMAWFAYFHSNHYSAFDLCENLENYLFDQQASYKKGLIHACIKKAIAKLPASRPPLMPTDILQEAKEVKGSTFAFGLYHQVLIQTLQGVKDFLFKLTDDLDIQFNIHSDFVILKNSILAVNTTGDPVTKTSRIMLHIRDYLIQFYKNIKKQDITLEQNLTHPIQALLAETYLFDCLNEIQDLVAMLPVALQQQIMTDKFMYQEKFQHILYVIQSCNVLSEEDLICCKIIICNIIHDLWEAHQIAVRLSIKQTSPLLFAIESNMPNLVELIKEIRPSYINLPNEHGVTPVQQSAFMVKLKSVANETEFSGSIPISIQEIKPTDTAADPTSDLLDLTGGSEIKRDTPVPTMSTRPDVEYWSVNFEDLPDDDFGVDYSMVRRKPLKYKTPTDKFDPEYKAFLKAIEDVNLDQVIKKLADNKFSYQLFLLHNNDFMSTVKPNDQYMQALENYRRSNIERIGTFHKQGLAVQNQFLKLKHQLKSIYEARFHYSQWDETTKLKFLNVIFTPQELDDVLQVDLAESKVLAWENIDSDSRIQILSEKSVEIFKQFSGSYYTTLLHNSRIKAIEEIYAQKVNSHKLEVKRLHDYLEKVIHKAKKMNVESQVESLSTQNLDLDKSTIAKIDEDQKSIYLMMRSLGDRTMEELKKSLKNRLNRNTSQNGVQAEHLGIIFEIAKRILDFYPSTNDIVALLFILHSNHNKTLLQVNIDNLEKSLLNLCLLAAVFVVKLENIDIITQGSISAESRGRLTEFFSYFDASAEFFQNTGDIKPQALGDDEDEDEAPVDNSKAQVRFVTDLFWPSKLSKPNKVCLVHQYNDVFMYQYAFKYAHLHIVGEPVSDKTLNKLTVTYGLSCHNFTSTAAFEELIPSASFSDENYFPEIQACINNARTRKNALLIVCSDSNEALVVNKKLFKNNRDNLQIYNQYKPEYSLIRESYMKQAIIPGMITVTTEEVLRSEAFNLTFSGAEDTKLQVIFTFIPDEALGVKELLNLITAKEDIASYQVMLNQATRPSAVSEAKHETVTQITKTEPSAKAKITAVQATFFYAEEEKRPVSLSSAMSSHVVTKVTHSANS
ncbi:MAG: ankyrin repeat domain-containing protein [Gammaproteobacteria bacterium]